MRFPCSLKTSVIAIVIAIVFVAAGVYAGAFLVERDGIRKALEDSVTRTALNVQAIGYIRDGKTEEAIDLLSSMNDGNVVYLMHYKDLESDNPDFARRKKRVLAALSKDRTDHPRTFGSFKSDPEWKQYQRDLENYLKQNQ